MIIIGNNIYYTHNITEAFQSFEKEFPKAQLINDQSIIVGDYYYIIYLNPDRVTPYMLAPICKNAAELIINDITHKRADHYGLMVEFCQLLLLNDPLAHKLMPKMLDTMIMSRHTGTDEVVMLYYHLNDQQDKQKVYDYLIDRWYSTCNGDINQEVVDVLLSFNPNWKPFKEVVV